MLTGCTTIAPYSQKSYEYATTIKVEALTLLGKSADEDFDSNKAKVDALIMDVNVAYEYANGIPKNTDITRMWAILKDEKQKGSLFYTLNKWKEKHKFDRAFVDEDMKKIAQEFDQIIELETGKNKASK